MGIIIKQSLKSSIYTYAGALLGFLNIGILWPRYLKEDEIGTIMLLMSFSSIFARIGGLGFSGAIIRFYPKFEDNGQRGGWPLLILTTSFVGSLLFLLIYFIVSPQLIANNSDKSPDLAKYFYLIIPLTIFQLLFFSLDNYSTVLQRSTIGIFLKEIVQRFFILFGIVLLIYQIFDFEKYVLWYVGSICIATLLLLIHLIYKNDFDLRKSEALFKLSSLKEMMNFSLFSFINGFSGPAIQNIDRIMINAFANSAATGIYGTTFYFGSLVSMPSRGLLKISSALIANANANDDINTVKDIYYKSCLNQFVIALWVFLGIWINIDNVFLILPEKFIDGKYVIFFIGLTQVVRMADGVNSSIIVYSKYYRYITLFLGLFLLFTILFNALLIPVYNLIGAAIASLMAVVLYLLMKWVFIIRKFKLQPYNYKYFIVILFAAISYFVTALLPTISNFIVDILLKSSCLTIIYLFLVFITKISPDINAIMIKAYRLITEKTAK